jgi:hypothetical protein
MSRRHCAKSLPTTVATPPKKRPEVLFKANGRRPLWRDPHGKSIRLHRLDLGVRDDVDASDASFSRSLVHMRGVGPNSSPAAKLGRIDVETMTFLRVAVRAAPATGDPHGAQPWSEPAPVSLPVRKLSTARRRMATGAFSFPRTLIFIPSDSIVFGADRPWRALPTPASQPLERKAGRNAGERRSNLSMHRSQHLCAQSNSSLQISICDISDLIALAAHFA